MTARPVRKTTGNTGQFNGSVAAVVAAPKAAPVAAVSNAPAGTAGSRPRFDSTGRVPLRDAIRGRTVAVREMNGYHDSDFRALAETPEGGFTWYTTGSTAYGGGFVASVDATDDVKERYRAWWDARNVKVQAAQAEHEAALVKPGRTVLVEGGRKYRGRVGTVTWVGENRYKSGKGFVHFVARVETGGDSFIVPCEYLRVAVSDEEFVPARGTMITPNTVDVGSCAEAVVFAEFPHPSRI